LRDVRAALRRMDDGTYGRCVGCGDQIDVRRLEILPQAACCLVCQPVPTRHRVVRRG
jgi:RNA polymerase-binding transcription factor DksA